MGRFGRSLKDPEKIWRVLSETGRDEEKDWR
jgi:hypothetical protein